MAEEKRREGHHYGRPWQTVNPFDTMRDVMNRMVDTVLEPLSRMAPPPPRTARGFQPSIDVIEEDEEVRVEVEVPGMSPDDLTVTVGQDSVVVKGEKKAVEEEGKGLHRRERAFGSFRRVIPLPVEIDRERVEAKFKNGVLTVILPKSHEAAKKVEIKLG